MTDKIATVLLLTAKSNNYLHTVHTTEAKCV